MGAEIQPLNEWREFRGIVSRLKKREARARVWGDRLNQDLTLFVELLFFKLCVVYIVHICEMHDVDFNHSKFSVENSFKINTHQRRLFHVPTFFLIHTKSHTHDTFVNLFFFLVLSSLYFSIFPVSCSVFRVRCANDYYLFFWLDFKCVLDLGICQRCLKHLKHARYWISFYTCNDQCIRRSFCRFLDGVCVVSTDKWYPSILYTKSRASDSSGRYGI